MSKELINKVLEDIGLESLRKDLENRPTEEDKAEKANKKIKKEKDE